MLKRQLFILGGGILALSVALGIRAQLPPTATGRVPEVVSFEAPEFVGGPWLNTGGKNLRLKGRRGTWNASGVLVVHFWTFG